MTSDTLIYHYDGSLAGFYCCVFASFYNRERPADIRSPEDAEPSLFEVRQIITEPEKEKRVRDSIPKKIDRRVLLLIEDVFLSALPHRERAFLDFLRIAYRVGPDVLRMHGHPAVAPILGAQRNLLHEAHLYKGFTRFADYQGVLVGAIRPKNCVLPYLAKHFSLRYPNESFLLYDKTHRLALIHREGQTEILPIDELHLEAVDRQEAGYQALWKQFYRTISIDSRYNPKCRMTHLPKRFWSEMLELNDLL